MGIGAPAGLAPANVQFFLDLGSMKVYNPPGGCKAEKEGLQDDSQKCVVIKHVWCHLHATYVYCYHLLGIWGLKLFWGSSAEKFGNPCVKPRVY